MLKLKRIDNAMLSGLISVTIFIAVAGCKSASYSSNSADVMLSRMDIIYAEIDSNDVNDAVVDVKARELIGEFKKQPQLPQNVFEIGRRYHNKVNYSRALHFYELVRKKWPKHDAALNAAFETGMMKIELADHNDVKALANEMIADFKKLPSLPQKLTDLGNEYYRYKNYAEAIALWELTLDNFPDSAPQCIVFFLGSAHKRIKDYATAARYYELSAAEYPECPKAWAMPYNLGCLYKQLREHEHAIYWFRQQSVLYSNVSTAAHALMGEGSIYLFRIKDYPKAAEIFQRYIDTYPDGGLYAEAHSNLGLSLERMGCPGAAIEVLERALRVCPDSIYHKEMKKKVEKLKNENR